MLTTFQQNWVHNAVSKLNLQRMWLIFQCRHTGLYRTGDTILDLLQGPLLFLPGPYHQVCEDNVIIKPPTKGEVSLVEIGGLPAKTHYLWLA